MSQLAKLSSVVLKLFGVYFILRAIPELAQLGALAATRRILDDVSSSVDGSGLMAASVVIAAGALVSIVIGVWLIIRSCRLAEFLLRDVGDGSTNVGVHAGTIRAVFAVAGLIIAATGIPSLLSAAGKLTPIAGESIGEALTDLYSGDWMYFLGLALQVGFGLFLAFRSRWIADRWWRLNS